MKYIYHGLLKLTTLAVVSLFLTVQSTHALESDIAPVGTGMEDSCVELSVSFGYRSSDRTTSGSVSELQNFLITKGYLQSEATGFFGSATLKAVKSYQGAKGFGQTGYVGSFTRGAIKTDSCGTVSTTQTGTTPTQTGATFQNTFNITGSTVTTSAATTIKGKVLNEDGKPADSAYLKCGKQGGDYVMYSPNSTTGEVSFSSDACKGGVVWVSCPLVLVATPASLSPTEFNGRTITCAKPSVGVTPVVTVSTSGVSASGSVSSQQFCPDGTIKPVVVVGVTTGCNNHEYKFALYTANSQSGPFTLNGTVYNNAPVYYRITGVFKTNSPKRCIQAAGKVGSDSCLSSSNYNNLIASEDWKDTNVIETTLRDVSNTFYFPLQKYEVYLLYPGQSPMLAGTYTLASKTVTEVQVNPTPTMTSSNYESVGYAANGIVYNNMPVYTRTKGFGQSIPQGCIQVKNDISRMCIDSTLYSTSYRNFTATELMNNDFIQTVVKEPSSFPLATYETYVRYPNSTSNNGAIKTGEFTLQAPSTQ